MNKTIKNRKQSRLQILQTFLNQEKQTNKNQLQHKTKVDFIDLLILEFNVYIQNHININNLYIFQMKDGFSNVDCCQQNQKSNQKQKQHKNYNEFLGQQVLLDDITQNCKLSNQQQIRQYQQFFKQLNISFKPDQVGIAVKHIYQTLRWNGFIVNEEYKPNQSQQQIFSVKISRTSNQQNPQIIELECQYHIYKKKFTILSNKNNNFTHDFQLISYGSYGSIYKCQHAEQSTVAIKCLIFKSNNREIQYKSIKNDFFLLALKQYFILNMMSALKIGPMIQNYLGFDMVIGKECIELSMEVCERISLKKFTDKEIKLMKNDLITMHLLNIVHLDIKLQNIMLSKKHKKLVFIDFGLSYILNLKQFFNFKTKSFTNFKGTASWCSQQMLNTLQKPNYVNLFLNDVKCLQKVFQKYSQSPYLKSIEVNAYQQQFQQKDKDNNYEFYQRSLIHLLKYFIFYQMEKQISFLFLQLKKNAKERQNQNNKKNMLKSSLTLSMIQIQVLQFLIKTNQSQKNFNFWYSQFQQNTKQSVQFQKFINLQNSHQTHFIREMNFNNQSFKNEESFFILINSNSINKQKEKKTLFQILTEESANMKLSLKPFLYVSLFTKFVSFQNNIYHSQLQQKYEVSLIFEKFVNEVKLISQEQIQEQFGIYNNFMPKSNYMSKELYQIAKCIRIVIAIVGKYQNKFQQKLDLIKLMKDSIFLNFNFYQLWDYFLNKLIFQKTSHLKKISNALMFSFNLPYLLETKFFKPFAKGYQTLFIRKIKNNQLIQIAKDQFETIKLQMQQNQSMNNKVLYQLHIVQNCLQFLFLINLRKSCQLNESIQKHLNVIQNILTTKKNYFQFDEWDVILEIFMSLFYKYAQVKSKQYIFLHEQFLNNISRTYHSYFMKNSFQIFTKNIQNLKMAYNYKNYPKMKEELIIFDYKINCHQVSITQFTFQRLALAFLQQNHTMINEIVTIILIGQQVQLINLRVYTNIMISIKNLVIDRFITYSKFQEQFLNLVVILVDKMTKSLLQIEGDCEKLSNLKQKGKNQQKIQNIEQNMFFQQNIKETLQRQYQLVLIDNYNEIMTLSREYFSIFFCFMQTSAQFGVQLTDNQILERLVKINSKIKSQISRYYYIQCMSTYFLYQNSFTNKKLDSTLIHLSFKLNSIHSMLDFLINLNQRDLSILRLSNLVIILSKIHSFKQSLTQKSQLSDYLTIFYLVERQDHSIYYMDDQVIQKVFFVLLYRQMFDQLLIYLQNLILFLKRNFSKVNFNYFINFLNHSYSKNCLCEYCIQKFPYLDKFNNKMLNYFKIIKIQDKLDNLYFTLIFIKHLTLKQINNKQRKQILAYIYKQFYYLNPIAQQNLLQQYYFQHVLLNMFIQNKARYQVSLKRYIKYRTKLTLSQIEVIYLKKIQSKKKKIAKSYQLAHKLIKKKITKMHELLMEAHSKKSMKQVKLLSQKQEKTKNITEMISEERFMLQRQKQIILQKIQIIFKKFNRQKLNEYLKNESNAKQNL